MEFRHTCQVIFLFIGWISFSECQKLKENIYTEIKNIRPCFRRLNSTNMIGCTSEKNGNVGVLMYVESEQDFDTIIRESKDFAPFVILVDPYIYSRALLHQFRSSGLVNGVLLPTVKAGKWTDHYPRRGFSDDAVCPDSFLPDNRASCSTQSPWNPSGTGVMWEQWPFPIILLENSTFAENVHECYETHNIKKPLHWPLCALELSSNMYAAKDSETCLRRSSLFNLSPVSRCDPLSDDNIHYFVSPRPKTQSSEGENSVILVTAKMDTLTMFDQVETGFDSPSSGIVTLLAVADSLSKKITNLPFRNGIQNILFILIQGESFDFIGSTRLVDDMEKLSFPFNNSDEDVMMKYPNGSQPVFKLSSIHSVIEIDQVSNADSEQLFLHTSNSPSDIVRRLQANAGRLQVSEVPGSLPPSSSVTLLRARPEIPTVVLTNYRSQFSNPMYHSIYDTAARAGYNYSRDDRVVSHLARLTEMVTDTVMELATGQRGPRTPGESGEREDLVNELLNCYTLTSNCSKFYEASTPDDYPWNYIPEARGKTPFPQYVGVRSSYHTLMTRRVLQLLTGEGVEVPESEDPVTGEEENTHTRVLGEMKRCRDLNKDQNIYR